MACRQDVMDQASVFQGALLRANAWRMEGGQLQLLDGAAVVATFAPQTKTLAGTSWRVTGYNNGKQAVASVLQDTTLAFAFTNDGKVEGTAGCNRFTATYASKNAALSFGPLAATKMMCAKPEKIMEQEQQFLTALGPSRPPALRATALSSARGTAPSRSRRGRSASNVAAQRELLGAISPKRCGPVSWSSRFRPTRPALLPDGVPHALFSAATRREILQKRIH